MRRLLVLVKGAEVLVEVAAAWPFSVARLVTATRVRAMGWSLESVHEEWRMDRCRMHLCRTVREIISIEFRNVRSHTYILRWWCVSGERIRLVTASKRIVSLSVPRVAVPWTVVVKSGRLVVEVIVESGGFRLWWLEWIVETGLWFVESCWELVS